MEVQTKPAFTTFTRQSEFIEAILSELYTVICYGGAIKGGKTIVGIAALIMLCRIFPGSRWAIVRANLPDIIRNVFPNLDKVLPLPFVDKDRRFSPADPHIEFKNKSRIIFFAENFTKDKDLNRWKGLDVNGFLLEEFNEIQEVSFYKAIERSGTYIIPGNVEQPKPIILATCNPSRGYVKQLIYDPWELGKLPEDWCFIPANIFDNPHLTPEYKASLKGLPKYQYMVFVEGNWNIHLKTGGEFLKEFELDIHLGNTGFDPEKNIHVSLDENVHPYITLTLWQIYTGDPEKKVKTKICQVHEILAKSPNNTIIKLARMLIRYLEQNDFNQLVYIYGDRTSLKEDTKVEKGKNFFNIFQNEINEVYKSRLRLPRVNPSVALSGAFVNAIFEKNFDNLEIEINEKCIESINDYVETKEDSDGGVLKLKVKDHKTGITYEPNGHITDTLRYFVCEAFKDNYRRFQTKNREFIRYIGHYKRGGK